MERTRLLDGRDKPSVGIRGCSWCCHMPLPQHLQHQPHVSSCQSGRTARSVAPAPVPTGGISHRHPARACLLGSFHKADLQVSRGQATCVVPWGEGGPARTGLGWSNVSAPPRMPRLNRGSRITEIHPEPPARGARAWVALTDYIHSCAPAASLGRVCLRLHLLLGNPHNQHTITININ